MTAAYKILIVDDDPNILEVLEERLSASNFKVLKAKNAAGAEQILKAKKGIDLLLSDIKMPGKGGMELFTDIRRSLPDLPVIFLTAYGTIPDAVDAIKLGAADYISKPFDGLELIEKINAVIALRGTGVGTGPVPLFESGFYWGKSAVMKHLYTTVKKVAVTEVNVLILGESGVGKECIAGCIHKNSPRKKQPYMVVDCGSTPAGILESELFGHLKGAFTHAVKDKVGLIEAAHSGTLFLDEIGNISHDMQCRMLRFLEDKKIRQVGAVKETSVDCRVIAATNADLAQAIDEGSFRQDLYYRLKGITLTIPPLRERKEDIYPLAEFFAGNYGQIHGTDQLRISDAAVKVLEEHPWPGNVRELKNTIEAGAVLCQNQVIEPWDLQIESIRANAVLTSDLPNSQAFSIAQSEKDTIIRALKESRGVQKDAADLLGISKRAMHYKVRKYDIDPTVYK
ncbi:sigma-54-dependent Fis family transcriptional regulator [Desulfobacter hydrogenophilus]|uniref:Sigma-54-dependent Fis family transcriptional regulator n=1 Tax=Desulfobacter hydrogenophilus TaxID=2291 RepID=A0A328FB79_9BACT|nr:sigma-54 dependent transcriptional regulator [Desulfobacter hydrogenophilus]NDY72985.1 sigma-54-dependent Fis family transcriptional regulator [Desulfobacter hydrogenophilus]QBH15240.1 sigma-54-dependent Fis family transcriptional regulator [Desulfobacter hydrogenophilus]RAM00930.1 sigma-54-dependent Fis family transcriptional regulator [Desulfobacter hydrogenophilus]